MKITKEKLQKIIQQETNNVIKEQFNKHISRPAFTTSQYDIMVDGEKFKIEFKSFDDVRNVERGYNPDRSSDPLDTLGPNFASGPRRNKVSIENPMAEIVIHLETEREARKGLGVDDMSAGGTTMNKIYIPVSKEILRKQGATKPEYSQYKGAIMKLIAKYGNQVSSGDPDGAASDFGSHDHYDVGDVGSKDSEKVGAIRAQGDTGQYNPGAFGKGLGDKIVAAMPKKVSDSLTLDVYHGLVSGPRAKIQGKKSMARKDALHRKFKVGKYKTNESKATTRIRRIIKEEIANVLKQEKKKIFEQGAGATLRNQIKDLQSRIPTSKRQAYNQEVANLKLPRSGLTLDQLQQLAAIAKKYAFDPSKEGDRTATPAAGPLNDPAQRNKVPAAGPLPAGAKIPKNSGKKVALQKVKELQQALVQAGLAPKEINGKPFVDGMFGRNTLEVVRKLYR